MSPARHRIVVATADTLGRQMAGPGIRARQIARALAATHDVRLVTTGQCTLDGEGFAAEAADDDRLREHIRWCDVFVFQGWILAGRPFLAGSDKILVADLYDPLHLEQLEQGRDAGSEGHRLAVTGATAALNEQLLRADFFLCASDKQRDLWLGHLGALGRINVRTYEEDPTLRSLIAVAPFGIEDHPPIRTAPAIRGVLPGVDDGDDVVLWGGGIYNWFDPLSLIEAVDELRHRRPRLRLVFMGLKHPNPEIPEMQVAVAAQAMAHDRGLVGAHVFFNHGWVPYDERVNHLLDADVGVSIHHRHLETDYSFRTRVLDYLWASLPVLTTEGDALGDLVERYELGITVPAGSVDAIVTGLDRLLGNDQFATACRRNIGQVAPQLTWSQALRPLVDFCAAPRRAPDLLDPDLAPTLARSRRVLAPERTHRWLHDVMLVGRHLREGGVGLLAQRVRSRLARTAAARRAAATNGVRRDQQHRPPSP